MRIIANKLDQMLLIVDGILAHGGEVKEIDFAQRLSYWIRHGFPVLGDLCGLGIGATVMVNFREISQQILKTSFFVLISIFFEFLNFYSQR